MEETPLEIKTERSAWGSNDRLIVWFFTASRSFATGGVEVFLSSTPRYYLNSCTTWTNFPTTLPDAKVKVWKIKITRTSDTRVVLHCNEKEVLNVLISSATCSFGSWNSYWSRDITRIKFFASNAANVYYRAGEKLHDGNNG